MRRLLAAAIAAAIFSAGCITSGKTFDDGILRREGVCIIPFYFSRDATHVSYSILYDNVIACGSSFAGNQYTDILFGVVEFVNIPGLSWLLYPFQYSDASTDSAVCSPLGIGSGYGDLRISLLWGFLSLGRNWNVFWINGFWHPGSDPLYFEKLQAEEKMP